MKLTIYIAIILTTLLQKAYGQTDIKIPFLFERNEIIVQAKINGKGSYNFLFDSGTNPSVINLKTAKKIGLQLKKIKGESEGRRKNPANIYLCYVPKMTLGNITQDSLMSVALNLSVFQSKFSVPVAGIIGYSFLHNKIFTIDYPKRKINFYKKLPIIKKFLVKKKFTLSNAKSVPVIDSVSLEGHSLKFLLDTGSRFSLKISPSEDSLYNFSKYMTQRKTEILEKYDSKAKGYSGELNNFKLGNIRLKSVRTVIDSNNKNVASDPLGSIGNELLKNYKVTFDYVDKRIIIAN